MRIIKDNDNWMTIMVAEMINIELGAWLFENGKIKDDLLRVGGYPSFTIENTVNDFVSNRGSIFLPMSFTKNIDNLIKNIIATRTDLLKDVPDRFKTVTKIHSRSWYHAVEKNKWNGTVRYLDMQLGKVEPLLNTEEFWWHFYKIDQLYIGSYSKNDFEHSLTDHICSIFIDQDNITSLKDNDRLFELSRKHLRGASNIIDTDVKLSNHFHILSYITNHKWFETSQKVGLILDSLQTNKICRADLSDLTQIGKSGSCASCSSKIYEKNYALVLEGQYCTVCPFCLHSNPDLINHVTYCVIIDAEPYEFAASPMLSLLSENIKKGIVKNEVYWEIGDEIVSFLNPNDYIYSKLVNDERFTDKKILNVDIV